MPARKIPKRGDRDESSEKIKDFAIYALASVIFVLLSAIFALSLAPQDQPKAEKVVKCEDTSGVDRLRYWSVVIYKWHDRGHVRTMDRTFERFNYRFVNASHGDDWDILWSIEQPFQRKSDDDLTLFADFANLRLRRHQKVNHFPGSGGLVTKSVMNQINAHLPYILPSFEMPHDLDRLDEFLRTHPNVKLVEKNIFNRGVQILERHEILEGESEFFYQQFMENHLLIDGHAFDMGIFVLVTSVDPLRVYRFDADVLFRFCAKPYHPFNPNDWDRYVVKSGCHNAYDMPSFENIYNRYGYPFVKIFDMLMRERGHDMDVFWTKVDDAIAKIVMNAESRILGALGRWKTPSQNCFELVRFDFLIDNDMNPFVMEVNMSPNLTPAEKRYEENCNMYEPLIYNVVQMIGGASHHEFMARFNASDIVVANHKNIATGLDTCLKYDCDRNCDRSECKICVPCLSTHNHFQAREAFREHSYQNNFRRLFPSVPHFDDEDLIANMTENNKISIEWFHAKCKEDIKWC